MYRSPWLLGERYITEDNTQVTLYISEPGLFTGFQPVLLLKDALIKRRVRVSLVATALNERQTAHSLFDSLMTQTRLPDEIVIVDTGSQDGTVEYLRELVAESPVPVKVLEEKGAKIARGRNLAIANAQGPVVAVTDFGCVLNPDWLEKLVAPFEIDPETQVSAGRYEPVDRAGQPVHWPLWPTLAQIDPQSYLPPSVSVAFTKEAWQRVGGYAEWLTMTGEDTYLDLELKRCTTHWAFVPEAVVRWVAPERRGEVLRKVYHWASGNGEIGYGTRMYRWSAYKISVLILGSLLIVLLTILAALMNPLPIAALVLLLDAAWGILFFRLVQSWGMRRDKFFLAISIDIAQLLGYSQGYRRRSEVDRRRHKLLAGVFFILSGVPIDDTGGGARCTQIALELLRRRYGVIFINKYPKYESKELDLQIRYPDLHTSTLQAFSLEKFLRKNDTLLPGKPVGVLIEFPLDEFLPLIQALRARGARVFYDLIDAWDTSLGSKWYSVEKEKAIVDNSAVLVTTVPALAERLMQISGRPAELLPNAVNRYLFNAQRFHHRPEDLPQAEWIIIYSGALWGEWFDWQLLTQIASFFPMASLVVIGDYRGQCPHKLPNMHFLGLKPQKMLPAYLAYSDVTIIPWKVNAITLATSPIKVYEYLAMHKPVVAPNLPLLQELPFVLCSRDQEHFLENIAKARKLQVGGEKLELFLSQNSWQTRVDRLLELLHP